MKIIIIGSEGFIGSSCVRHFLRNKANDIVCCDLLDEEFISGSRPEGIDYIRLKGKVTDTSNMFENVFGDAIRYDVCINAAGSADVQRSFVQPDKDFEMNVLLIHRLLEAIRKHQPKCKLVNFSSAAVYGNAKELPISEDSPLEPCSPYGGHKRISELMLSNYSRMFKIGTCSLRVFSAYGPGQKKLLFWDIYQKSKQDSKIRLYGTGDESRDYIYIDDLCSAIEIVISKAEFCGEAINVATGKESRIREVAQNFVRLLPDKHEVVFSSEKRVGDPSRWKADISKLKSMGFSPSYDMDKGLGLYARWLEKEKA